MRWLSAMCPLVSSWSVPFRSAAWQCWSIVQSEFDQHCPVQRSWHPFCELSRLLLVCQALAHLSESRSSGRMQCLVSFCRSDLPERGKDSSYALTALSFNSAEYTLLCVFFAKIKAPCAWYFATLLLKCDSEIPHSLDIAAFDPSPFKYLLIALSRSSCDTILYGQRKKRILRPFP